MFLLYFFFLIPYFIDMFPSWEQLDKANYGIVHIGITITIPVLLFSLLIYRMYTSPPPDRKRPDNQNDPSNIYIGFFVLVAGYLMGITLLPSNPSMLFSMAVGTFIALVFLYLQVLCLCLFIISCFKLFKGSIDEWADLITLIGSTIIAVLFFSFDYTIYQGGGNSPSCWRGNFPLQHPLFLENFPL
jgi:hypothetical protein